jgi:hypothetical protein
MGLNVWVEDGDVLFYISRSGSLNELNEYVKLGRVRLRLDPNPFGMKDATFRQELALHEGCVQIRGSASGHEVSLRVWVEVHRPVVHVEVESGQEIDVTATYENWRMSEEILPNDARRHACFELLAFPGEVRLTPDHVAHADGGVLFYHRNPADNWLRGLQIKQQGLQVFRDEIPDDLSNRTFGGFLTGNGFHDAGETAGTYQTRAYKGWRLRSEKPARLHHLRVITHIAQEKKLEKWQQDLDALTERSRDDVQAARAKTVAWWREFWDRSWIVIKPEKPDAGERAWRVGRNYNLFRYQLGCNAFGEYPSKFNGGSFTFDANLVGEAFKQRGPDWRQWGGGVFTAQNQRLLYWPMLKTGDVDAILPQFELYRKALPGARARVKANFQHEGAIFCEYIGVSGLAVGSGYGWESGVRNRGEDIPFGDPRADGLHHYGDPVEKGVMSNKSISYHWESQLEHAYMILEYHRFTGADITAYIPFIENAVVFFDEHYRKRERMRSGRDLDKDGRLVIYPSKACETYRGATNPTDLIAGLMACLDEIAKLDDSILKVRDKAYYRKLQTTIPRFSYGEMKGKRVILPAASWKEYANSELPMFYPLFPFNRFALGRDDMQVFRDTYQVGDFRKGNVASWHQDGIFFARMGQTELAADFNARKLDDSERRFPTYWGPGHDWVPDHNWGGSGMIGLQEMLMQTIGDEIRLFPAWPKDWNCSFKLHAPRKTVVQGELKNGKLINLVVTPENRRKDIVNHLSAQPAKVER